MRFYEYEAKALFARHGTPLLKGRVARTAAEAKQIAAEIGAPVVLKSQVLTGGRMKAGGVKFADDPAGAEAAAAAILALEIKGQKPRGVLVEQKVPVAKEYFVAVTWDGRKKLPVIVFSDMGGIDVEEVAEKHPEHVSRTHLSTLTPFLPYKAKEAVAAVGVSGDELNRIAPIVATLVEIFLRYDLTLAEINPLGKTEDGRFLVLDGHIDLEADARDKHAKLLEELGIGKEETREARPPTEFEIKGAQVGAGDHGGVAGNVKEFDGNLGLVIGAGGGSLTLFDAIKKHGGKPANYCEIGGNPSVRKACELTAHPVEAGCREDRGHDERRPEHPRRHRRPRVIKAGRMGRDPEDDRDLRIRGVGDDGFRSSGSGVAHCDRTVSMYEAAGRAVAKLS